MAKELRVMQMIDSLSIGGAERVSVNYANAISEQGYQSFHCTTREEGMLKEFLNNEVGQFFMQKKSLFDFSSYLRLIRYIKENRISLIHAHSSSFFTAIIAKLFTGVKIVWHDHYGKSENINERPIFALKIGSLFFSYVISVNKILSQWAEDKLLINKEKIEYVPNYADLKFDDTVPDIPGVGGKRIVLLANLRPQKDHLTMLKAYKRIIEDGYTDWHLLFVGRDWEDDYSNRIKGYISTNSMGDYVSVLGGRSDTAQILKHCDIGVLSSESEGLPVALLEYGLASLAVVCTDVGECSAVLDGGKVGELVQAKDSSALYQAVRTLVDDKALQRKKASLFYENVQKDYSKESIMKHIIQKYKACLC